MARAPCSASSIAAYATPRLELNSTRLMRSSALCIEKSLQVGQESLHRQKSLPGGRIPPSWMVEKTAAEPAQDAADRRRFEILTRGAARASALKQPHRMHVVALSPGRIQRRITAT